MEAVMVTVRERKAREVADEGVAEAAMAMVAVGLRRSNRAGEGGGGNGGGGLGVAGTEVETAGRRRG